MKKYRGIKNKAGSITVEAAVFLPIFLISILTLGLLIRQIGVEETVLHSMLNQGRLASVSAYSSQQIPSEEGVSLGSRLLFQAGIETQLSKELQLDPETVRLFRFQYLYKDGRRDNLIEAVVRYRVKIPLPRAVAEAITGEQRVVLRAFLGRTGRAETTDAADMEREKESRIVYVFPRSGERYHRESCKTITSTPVKVILTAAIRRRYSDCSLCDAESIPGGSFVYCFTGYGEVYHRGICKSVEKYVVPMEQEQAVEKGYSPCQKCGG